MSSYVVKVKSGTEAKTVEAIKRNVESKGLSKQLVEVSYPFTENDKKQKKPTMSGYLFITVKTDAISPELINCINSTENVSTILTNPKTKKSPHTKPIKLSSNDEEKMKNVSNNIVDVKNTNRSFSVGDNVKFGNFQGKIATINQEKNTALVTVLVFKQETSIEIDLNDPSLELI